MDLEQMIQNAAEEVRQVTRAVRPPEPREGARVTPAGWLAFAVAFAGVVLAIGVLPSLLGSDEPGPGGTSDTTVPVVTPSTGPPVECSAAGVKSPLSQEGLPQAVADVRAAVIAAAASCDFQALATLAGERFTTSFGGGGSEMFEEWESMGDGKLGILIELFGLSFARQEFEGDAAQALGSSVLYVWPAAFDYDTWEEIPDALIEELLAIHTQEELDQIAGFGSYAGWRTGITEEGDWAFFVAGD